MHLSIDVMGGDLGPRPCILAASKFLADYPSTSIELIGRPDQIHSVLEDIPSCKTLLQVTDSRSDPDKVIKVPRLSVVAASEVVEMTDQPVQAMRQKKDSSMSVSLKRLGDGHSQACVSGGNTGALVVTSMHILGTCSEIKRPAICKAIPTKKGLSYLLDLGANLKCDAYVLKQFAIMAAALFDTNISKGKARVSLLNVGIEENKGLDVLLEAADLLSQCDQLEYCGFIEGNNLFDGDVDVIVCDGFSGNIALKSSEGTAQFIFSRLNTFLKQGVLRRIFSYVLNPWLESLNPSLFNGAIFLGLNNTVVKSHGGADEKSFYNAIKTAYELAQKNIPTRIASFLNNASS